MGGGALDKTKENYLKAFFSIDIPIFPIKPRRIIYRLFEPFPLPHNFIETLFITENKPSVTVVSKHFNEIPLVKRAESFIKML